MPDCTLCSNAFFRELSIHDKDMLVHVAREIIKGLLSTTKMYVKPARRKGICIVERCARAVEAPCGACGETSCQRCVIAAELRSAEDRINAERDAELAEIGISDQELDQIIDNVVEDLCPVHVVFGAVLAGEWYGRKNFAASPTVAS